MILLVACPVIAIGLFMVAMVYAVKFQAAKKKHEDIKELRKLQVPDDTLFCLFQPHLVSSNLFLRNKATPQSLDTGAKFLSCSSPHATWCWEFGHPHSNPTI